MSSPPRRPDGPDPSIAFAPRSSPRPACRSAPRRRCGRLTGTLLAARPRRNEGDTVADVQTPWFLAGNYAPVRDEVTAHALPVPGAVPRALAGPLRAQRPQPDERQSPHWFFGDGMLHGVELRDGGATWYRNRWVRTRCFVEDAPPRSTRRRDPTAGAANTHVVAHAGRILALVETSPRGHPRPGHGRQLRLWRATDHGHDRAPEDLSAHRRAALLRLLVRAAVPDVPPRGRRRARSCSPR